MNIWRTHIKPASKSNIDPRQLCLEKGIFGVGWQIDYKKVPVTWDKYWTTAKDKYANNKSWEIALETIKNKMQIGDLIWTRDKSGNYFLGRILSDWYYDTTEDCARADVVNVRKCEWHEIGTVEAVPGKVVSSFRATRTVQRIKGDTICDFSQLLYNKKVKKTFYKKVDTLKGKDVFSLLSTDDCEDALAIYLQVMQDYFVIPSSCKRDTMKYEFVLKHRKTGKNAVAQVKSGKESLNIDDYSKLKTDVFLFATSGKYLGKPKSNIKTIDPDVIRKFLYKNTHLLPNKIKLWVEQTK